MSLYDAYLEQIENRKEQGLKPKPIDDGGLVKELVAQIKDAGHAHRAASLDFFIYNTLPGTTSAAGEKAAFLNEIILGEAEVPELSRAFAFELLSHMKGGPSISVLLDLALGDDAATAAEAAEVLKTQVFLYEADKDRLKAALAAGNPVARAVLESYSDAEFFTRLPEVDEEIKVVTYIAAEGDISTDLLSPGNQAHSRSDRELHGKCLISERAQQEIEALKLQHPDKQVMLIAEKGTMGVGSSRMSGINNVALWTGKQASKYVPFINIAPIVAGTNGISPIFQTTVGVTGGIGIDLQNWVKKLDADGNPILNNDENPILEQTYSVVQHLVDDVGHRVVLVLRITAGDQAEIIHEPHQLRRVLGGLEIPDRRGVAARLVGAVDLRRDHGGGHRLQLLRRHRAGGVLRADDIDPHPHIRSGMQRGARRDADGIGVEDFFHRGQALPLDRDLLRRRESGFQRNAQRLAGEGLQHLAEDDGVGPAGADEFHLLRGEG